VLVTLFLLAPLRLLIGHLREATSNLKNMEDMRPLPSGLRRYMGGFWAKSDEFSSLLNAVQKLIDRINQNYKLTRSWTLQMAHELKTPLAIIKAETQSKKKSNLLPEAYAQDVISEVQHMSETISQFLDWAELENSELQRDLHALRMKTVVKSVASRLEKINPGRIRLELHSDFSVFANPSHVDQLITNLLTNALKFSPESEKVDLVLSGHSLMIRDYGPGLPKEVKERIGIPFNVGTSVGEGQTGSGLGLAWISTVARLYRWEFAISSDGTGTNATVRFPMETGG